MEQFKSNDIHNGGVVKIPKTDHSHSGVKFLENINNDEVKLGITTTTDVLTDVLSNVVSVLLNIEMKTEGNDPVFILREGGVEGDQLTGMWRIQQENAIRGCLSAYQFAMNNGMSLNKASSILPVGNTMIDAEIVVSKSSILEDGMSGMSNECKEIIQMCRNEIK